jgi:hypothetical protein
MPNLDSSQSTVAFALPASQRELPDASSGFRVVVRPLAGENAELGARHCHVAGGRLCIVAIAAIDFRRRPAPALPASPFANEPMAKSRLFFELNWARHGDSLLMLSARAIALRVSMARTSVSCGPCYTLAKSWKILVISLRAFP